MTKKADTAPNTGATPKAVKTSRKPKAETGKAPEVHNPEVEKVPETGDIIQNQLVKFNLADSAINDMIQRSEGLELTSLEDREKFEQAKGLLKEFVSARTGLDTKRKEIYKPFQTIVDSINDEAKRLTGLMSPTEKKLKAEVDKFLAWEKEEAEKAKKKAEEKLKARVKELEDFGLAFNGAYYVCGDISMDIATLQNLSDTDYLVLGEKVKVAKKKIDDEEAERLKKEEAERKEREEAQAKLDEQKKKNDEEAERLKKEGEAQQAEISRMRIENRGYKLEAIGATTDEATFHFKGESDTVSLEKSKIGEMDEEAFKVVFDKFQTNISRIKKDDADLKEKREKQAKEKADREAKEKVTNARFMRFDGMKFGRLETGFSYGSLLYTKESISEATDEDFEALAKSAQEAITAEKDKEEKEAEALRLAQLPEIERLEKYIKDLGVVNPPKLQNESINQILADLKNDLKLAQEKALKSIETIKK